MQFKWKISVFWALADVQTRIINLARSTAELTKVRHEFQHKSPGRGEKKRREWENIYQHKNLEGLVGARESGDDTHVYSTCKKQWLKSSGWAHRFAIWVRRLEALGGGVVAGWRRLGAGRWKLSWLAPEPPRPGVCRQRGAGCVVDLGWLTDGGGAAAKRAERNSPPWCECERECDTVELSAQEKDLQPTGADDDAGRASKGHTDSLSGGASETRETRWVGRRGEREQHEPEKWCPCEGGRELYAVAAAAGVVHGQLVGHRVRTVLRGHRVAPARLLGAQMLA